MKTRQIKKTGKLLGASLLTLAFFASSFGCVPLTAKAENEPLDLYYISDSSEPIYDELLEEICGEYENRMEINLTSLAIAKRMKLGSMTPPIFSIMWTYISIPI